MVVLLGMAMASRDALFQALDPARPFASRITPLARSPLLVAWFGIGEVMQVLSW